MKPRQPSRASGKRWQFHQAPRRRPGRCGAGHVSPNLRRTTRAEVQFHMPADALKCKECSDHLSARGALRLRALLRPARGRLRGRRTATPEELKRRIQAGPHTLWRYADFLPLEGPPRSALPTGWTPLVQGRSPRRSGSGSGELWIKNETANPTHSFKDRVVSVALARAQELGFETIACASTGNLANAVAAHAAAAGLPVLRAYPARPRGAEDPRHRRLRRPTSSPFEATTTTSTGSAPRSRASGRRGRS